MNSVATLEKSKRIRVLNDDFRTTFIGGRVVMSAGVADLSFGMKAQVMLKVQCFVEFNENNDPYGEHDFGSFEVAGETCIALSSLCSRQRLASMHSSDASRIG